jgi:hypothetical protein
MLNVGDCAHAASMMLNTVPRQATAHKSQSHFDMVAICVLLLRDNLDENGGSNRSMKRRLVGAVLDAVAVPVHWSDRLVDHLVGGGQQRLRHGQAERLGGFQIDHQFELCRLNNRSSPTLRRGRDIFSHVEKSAEFPQGASRLRPACA